AALSVLETLVREVVPDIIEQMHRMEFVDQCLGRMMRRVRGARDVVAEEFFVWIDLILLRQITDRFVGHAGDKVPTGMTLEWVDLGGVAKQIRLPLVGVGADGSLEVIEAHPERPLVERADSAGGVARRGMILAEPRSGITVVAKNPP